MVPRASKPIIISFPVTLSGYVGKLIIGMIDIIPEEPKKSKGKGRGWGMSSLRVDLRGLLTRVNLNLPVARRDVQ